jgi:hypothetical protein
MTVSQGAFKFYNHNFVYDLVIFVNFWLFQSESVYVHPCIFYETLQVVLVGLVRTANETTTRLDYTIDDMTGPPLEVRQFVDNDVSTLQLSAVVLWITQASFFKNRK